MSADMVEITAELITQGMTGPGGWIAEQLKVIGAWPTRSGWRQRAIGRKITKAEAEAFIAGRKLGDNDTRAKRRARIRAALAGDTACPLCHGSKRASLFVDATGRSTGEPCALCADQGDIPDSWELLHIVSLSLEGATKPGDAYRAIETATHIFRFSPSSFAGVADRQSAAVAGFLRQVARILKPGDHEPDVPPWEPVT
jgi:hypothetical protein